MADVMKDHHDWTREGGYAPKAPEAAPTPVELTPAQKESLAADESTAKLKAEKEAEEAAKKADESKKPDSKKPELVKDEPKPAK